MRNFAPPTTDGSRPRQVKPPRLRRTGFVIALTLGITGFLAGAAAPAGAATVTGSSAAQQAWPDGGGRGGGDGHGGRGGGDGRGHGHGRDRTIDYVAFGDSYAAGVGGGTSLDACGRTAEGYPNLLDDLRRVELDGNQSCSGATTITTPPAPPAGPVDLPEQITAAVSAGQLNERTDLVTVTIGGNDVQYGSLVAACTGEVLPATCAPALAAAQSFAETAVAPQLQASFAAILEAAPQAELVLTGYPHLFEGTVPGILSVEAQNLFNAGTDDLNTLLAEQVGDGTFVDVTEAFAGHGIGSADSWIVTEGPAILHPTAAGYSEGYLPAITDVVDVLNRNSDGSGHGGGGCRGRG